jgi:hypothetical protein
MTLAKHIETSEPSVSALDATSLPRHRWYFFKEAFSPDIVTHAIKETACKPGDLVVDPFSGSGTTVLAAARKGLSARGSEVNPFLAFVAHTKLTNPRVAALESLTADMIRSARKGKRSPLQGFSTFTATEGVDKWLFNDVVLQAFTGAWDAATTIPTHSRSVVRLALLGAAMDTCNAVRDGKCLRYRSNWQESTFDKDDFCDAFEARMIAITDDVVTAPVEAGLAKIRVGDSRIGGVSGGKRFKLCVMSPPYLNSFDYTDVYRPELFLGGFVKDMADLRRLRLTSLRSHVQVKWSEPKGCKFGAHFDTAYNSITSRAEKLWNRRIPMMLKAYFEDMHRVLRSLRDDAADGASLWIVVSTSAYAGVEIPVDLILADVGCQVGWVLKEVRTLRHLRRLPVQQWDQLAAAALGKVHSENRSHAGPHLRESLIILDATARK